MVPIGTGGRRRVRVTRDVAGALRTTNCRMLLSSHGRQTNIGFTSTSLVNLPLQIAINGGTDRKVIRIGVHGASRAVRVGRRRVRGAINVLLGRLAPTARATTS